MIYATRSRQQELLPMCIMRTISRWHTDVSQDNRSINTKTHTQLDRRIIDYNEKPHTSLPSQICVAVCVRVCLMGLLQCPLHRIYDEASALMAPVAIYVLALHLMLND